MENRKIMLGVRPMRSVASEGAILPAGSVIVGTDSPILRTVGVILQADAMVLRSARPVLHPTLGI